MRFVHDGEKKKYHNARSDCESKEGRLVTLDDEKASDINAILSLRYVHAPSTEM